GLRRSGHAPGGRAGPPRRHAPLRGRVPRPDPAVADRPGRVRARDRRQPDGAVVAEPGLPAAAVAQCRRRAGVRAGRHGTGRQGQLGRLWRCPPRARRTGGDAPCRVGQLDGAGVGAATGSDADRPARPCLRGAERPRCPRSGRGRASLRDPAVGRRGRASWPGVVTRRVGGLMEGTGMTIASAALLLFLILDPLGNIPVFLSLLRTLPPQRQRIVLARELLIALGVLMAFLWGGKYFLEVMHLRQESVSIAGGIV